MIKRFIRGNLRAFRRENAESGQALVEYALLLVLLVISFAVALAATGPAIGNVFGNVVFNIIGQDQEISDAVGTLGGPDNFWATVTWVAQNPQQETPFVSLYTPPAPATATPLTSAGLTAIAGTATSSANTATANAAATNVQGTLNAQATGTQNANATLTATNAPPATATDSNFNLPFVDQATNVARWRLTGGTPNPDNVATSGDPCTWAVIDQDANSASRTTLFDNATTDSWAANRTCYLELRGKLRLGSVIDYPNPRLSFWHRWDFSGASNVTAAVQVVNWTANGDGTFNRAGAASSWVTLPIISTPTTNYNWTRYEIDLTNFPGFTLGPAREIALRFRLQSSTNPSTLVRWYIDDIAVLNEPTPTRVLGLNQAWNLNTRDQMDDFIFTADSARALESIGQSPGNSWRWNLTGNNARSGFAWDDSPFGNYPIPSEGSSQQHQLRTRYPIDLATAAATDANGNIGDLILSFWYAYDIPDGARLEVQYSTEPATNLNPSTWTTFADGLLVDFDDPSGAPTVNQQTARTNLSMQRVEINLESIKTTPFRVRFLMTVNSQHSGVPTVAGQGWYIDDMRIERKQNARFAFYPFTDGAEDSTFTANNWLGTGQWGIAFNETNINGINGTSQAYADSPGNTNYAVNTTSTFTMQRVIDLLNDTTPKLPADQETGRPAASRPFLSFWHQRDFMANATFFVDAKTERRQEWVTIWSYNGETPLDNIEGSWERVEIDLRDAVARATAGTTGVAWTWGGTGANSITANTDLLDDDVSIRFRMVVSNTPATTDRGLYIDDIRIGEQTERVWRLWPTGSGGNGTAFEDNIESATAGLASAVTDRWHLGAFAVQTAPTGCTTPNQLYDYRGIAGGSMLADSRVTGCLPDPSGDLANAGKYRPNNLRIVEMQTIIDLTSTPVGSVPTLYFWTRRLLNASDFFRVQVAVENTSDTGPQAYNNLLGWDAWTNMSMLNGVTGYDDLQRDTWQREAVNLTPHIGKRIRIRFLLQSNNDSNRTDGVYIDGVRVTYNATAFTLPLTAAQTALSSNWVAEGRWGAAQDFIYTGAATSALPAGVWMEDIYAGTDLSGSPLTPRQLLPEISRFMGGGAPYSGGPTETFSIRYQRSTNGLDSGRDITLSPGTYTFSVIGDDGYRLYTNSNTGIAGLSSCSSISGQFCIIEAWGTQAPTLRTRTLTVTSSSPRRLTLDYFENTGGAVIAMSVSQNEFSFTDSPNNYGTVYPISAVMSLDYGDSSLILNGYINTTAAPGTQVLSYRRLYWLENNQRFHTEVSSDGGFTWTNLNTVSGYIEMLPVSGNDSNAETTSDTWQLVSYNLPEAARVVIRFRMETFAAGTNNIQDGVYITDVRVN
ncbi:MAG: hypothetical protein SF162_02025 [bacterium]|nr:hypothetical protein [bacterium]